MPPGSERSAPRKDGAAEDRQGADSRAVALDLLAKVLRRSQPLDQLLASHGGLARLSTRDRAFARLLVTTTLRRLGQIDALVDHGLRRPLAPDLARVQDILRLGICQLVFLGTPGHAAVNSTVGLTAGPRLARYRALVNAVLRRLGREGAALVASQDAVRLNTPAWLRERWRSAYGDAQARAMAAGHLAEPPLDLSLREPDGAQSWAERLDARILPTGSLRLAPGQRDVRRLAGYAEGAWWVQDAAAVLPARLLGPVAGLRTADLCAAPGGKTASLAVAGARVTAVDRSPARLGRLSENLTRLGLTAEVVEADVWSWRPGACFDRVLLDAPCTATGTLRRHPDVAWLRAPEDIAQLAEIQARLLRAAADLVAPGGTLVYSVCSLEPEEGPDQVARLLATGPGLARRPVGPDELPGLDGAVTPEGDLRTLPCHLGDAGGMDGFFAARLTKDS